ncbi:MAG: DUF177 domain-containing protein [Bryobacteraceae bacterium]|nr:DUF177 domain-containing protein [Bryobacteraceae bacterium]
MPLVLAEVCALLFTIQELERRPARFDVALEPGTIEFFDPKLRQISPLRAHGSVELMSPVSGEIRTRGRLAVEMEAECDRCLEPVRMPLDEAFEVFAVPLDDRRGPGEEVEIHEPDTAVEFYDGSGIELDNILREEILLKLPMRKVCREDCKGICPQCGRNRNAADCECRPGPVDDRWSALKEL